MAKLREINTENVEGTEGKWVPWSIAAQKEGGEDLLKEMVDAGTVVCRRNPKLPASSKIPWPKIRNASMLWRLSAGKKARGN